MTFVKKYLLWIGLGVVLLAFLGAQFLWVGAEAAAVYEKNEEVVKAVSSLKSQTKPSAMKTVPTKGDVAVASKHRYDIQASGENVQKLWLWYTGGMNRYMSNNRRKNGRISHPNPGDGEDPVIDPARFSDRIRRLYKVAFDDMKTALKARMMPGLIKMEADLAFATSDEKTRKQAAEEAPALAKRSAERLVNIVDSEKLIPIQLEDVFSDRTRAEREKMWQAWRAYLIARDILVRVVPNAEARVARTLTARLPVEDEKRLERAGMDEQEKKQQGDLGTFELKSEGWRYVQYLSALTVDNPVFGNSRLKAQGAVEEEKEEEEPAAVPVPAAKPANEFDFDFGDEESTPAGEVDTGPVYHDEYTLTIEMIAHMAVVRDFMRELLHVEKPPKAMVDEPAAPAVEEEAAAAEGDAAEAPAAGKDDAVEGGVAAAAPATEAASRQIWYVPVSASFERYPEAVTHGDYYAAKKEAMGQSVASSVAAGEGAAAATTARDEKSVLTVAGSEYEPPVKATLVYRVYRFRYRDTDNCTRPSAAGTTTGIPEGLEFE